VKNEAKRKLIAAEWGRRNIRLYERRHGDYIDLVPRVYRGNNYLGCVRAMRISSANLCGGPKKQIYNFSSKSRKAMMMKLDSLCCVFKPNYFLTLTYPKDFPRDGRLCKSHLQRLFAFLKGQGEFRGLDSDVKFFWKMEFQSRDALHYHILVESSLPLDDLKSAVIKKWKQLTGNTYEWGGVDLSIIRDDFRARIYTALYTQKKHQNIIPEDFQNAGRFWGVMGITEPTDSEFLEKRGGEEFRKNKFCLPVFGEGAR
jgi:hypothetical protein